MNAITDANVESSRTVRSTKLLRYLTKTDSLEKLLLHNQPLSEPGGKSLLPGSWRAQAFCRSIRVYIHS